MKFLKEIVNVPINKIRIRAYIYPDISIEDSKKFWLQNTNLPEYCWYKPHVKVTLKNRNVRNLLKFGTLHVMVYSVNLKLKLIGMINGLRKWVNNNDVSENHVLFS